MDSRQSFLNTANSIIDDANAGIDQSTKIRSGMLSSLNSPKFSSDTVMMPEFKAGSLDSTYIAPPAPSGGGGGGSVICTKFYKLGLCEKEIYYCEHKWGG